MVDVHSKESLKIYQIESKCDTRPVKFIIYYRADGFKNCLAMQLPWSYRSKTDNRFEVKTGGAAEKNGWLCLLCGLIRTGSM